MPGRRSDIVLIADDDPSIRTTMRAALRREGFDVIEASNGKEAVAAFEEHEPCMVLLDVEMPVMDGFTACKQIRKMSAGPIVPIVIVTGRDDLEAVNRAYEANATDFIAKPITWPVFTHRIRHIMRASDNYLKLSASELKNAALLRAIPDELFVLNTDGIILEHLPGDGSQPWTASNGRPVHLRDHLPTAIAAQCTMVAAKVSRTKQPHHAEFTDTRDGHAHHFEGRFIPYLDDQVLIIMAEVTERKQAEERIHKLAYFDPLTGLPNRQHFMQHLESMIESAHKHKAGFALLYVDLDNFKRINDILGHSYGDGVLKAVAERLSGCIRGHYSSSSGTEEEFRIARLGGDEFVLTVDDVDDERTLTRVAERIRKQLREPVEFRGHEFVVTPSVGIVMYPQDGENVEDLLKHADVALYQAKGAGRDSIRFYRGAMSLRSLHRLELETGLRRAIEQGDLELHYQPKYDLIKGGIVGVEALVRWRDDDGDYVPPAQFIPMAEESGLITPLGEWVLHAACAQARDWKTRLGLELPIAVNVSSHQIYHSDLHVDVIKALFDASVRPNLLQLEITESLLMRDAEDTIRTLNYLKDAGVSVAIDDFGTGYSSLSYLKKFPIDALKIDRSFVMELEGNNDDAVICMAIIAMAHSLGMKVIAEGIETETQLEFLRDNGCDQGQGYFLGRPLPSTDFETTLNNEEARAIRPMTGTPSG